MFKVLKDGRALRHPLLGMFVAFLAATVDAIIMVARGEGTALEFTMAWAHLVAFALPFGFVLGGLFGTVTSIPMRSSWTKPIRARFSSRIRFFSRDDRGVAGSFALAIGGLAFVLGTRGLAEHFATRYYNPTLAAWAMALATFIWLGASSLLALAVREVSFRALRSVSRAPSFGAFLFASLGVGAVGAALVGWLARETLVYVANSAAWLLGVTVVYLSVVWLTRHRETRWRTVALSSAVCIGAALINSYTYGASSRVRGLVESQSDQGRSLVRFYVRLTDRDGDGHSFAYGGGDCDDHDELIYPGAFDLPGDGIDMDCFDGDGTTTAVVRYGDGDFAELSDAVPRRPNIVLVTVDALRFDHLGCSGYEKKTSPRIDAFCEDAIVFETAIAQSSRSLRSIPSMLSGRYAGEVAFGPEYLWPALLEENELLPETLSGVGYDTHAVMGTDYFARVAGFFQGFDELEQSPVYIPSRHWSVDRGISALRQPRQTPLFLWVHLFNVHVPYLQDGIPSRFGPGVAGEYDTEIAFADQQFGRILDAIDELGQTEDTVVILASDHGEALGEHNHRGHSETLYGEELGAVLMLRIPNIEGRRIEERIGLLDLYPTVLNVVRVDMPAPTLARSLLPAGLGQPFASRPLFSELLPDGLFPFDQKAIYDGGHKLIWWIRDGTVQLFDVEEDANELRNIADDDPALANELHHDLRAWMTRTARRENRAAVAVGDNRLERFPASMDHRVNVVYPGMFRLVGYDVNRDVAPRDTIDVVLYVEVLDEIEEDLFFHLDLIGPSGRTHATHFHGFHYPLNGTYRTFQWRPGERLRDPVPIVVPPDLSPVELDLRLTILDEARRTIVGSRNGETIPVLDMGQVRVGDGS